MILIFPNDVILKPYEKECSYGGRCLPHQPCWPSSEKWKSLNESVHGRLSIPHLTVQPCLEDYETETCQESLEKMGEDPFYLEQIPGGVESTGTYISGLCTANPFPVMETGFSL